MVEHKVKAEQPNAKTLKIEVIVKRRKNHLNGHDFTCYACKMRDGKWYDLKFTKDVPQDKLPKSHSNIYVLESNINLDKRTKYLKVWVKAVERLEMIEKPLEDLTQYFELEPEDLPF